MADQVKRDRDEQGRSDPNTDRARGKAHDEEVRVQEELDDLDDEVEEDLEEDDESESTF